MVSAKLRHVLFYTLRRLGLIRSFLAASATVCAAAKRRGDLGDAQPVSVIP
jgi:hypothetical protein